MPATPPTRDLIMILNAAAVPVAVLPAKVKWTRKLMGADELGSVNIPWEYIKGEDGSAVSWIADVETGWFALYRSVRYIIEDPHSDRETGLDFKATSAEVELSNYFTNYSPGPATYLNRTPTEIMTALLAGKIGRPFRNPGFGILDASSLPTNWSHPTGWVSATVSNRRVWQADAGTEESYSDDRPCTPGVSYQVKVDIKAAGTTGTRGVLIRWIKADGTTVDSATTNLVLEDSAFHEVATGAIVALGTRLRVVLVTSGTTAVTEFDDVRLYEIGPDTGWTYSGSMDTRAAAIPFTDGAIVKYGVWTTGATYTESSTVGDYVGRVVSGPFVTINWKAAGGGATCKVRINGVQYTRSGSTLIPGTAAIDVSADLALTCSGLDPNNDHLVEVEVAAVKTRFGSLTVSTENLISMRWDEKSVYEALVSVRQAVGGELSFNTVTKVITHAASIGQDLKANSIVEFRRGSNIVKMDRTEDRSKLVNRLTGIGYGDGEYKLLVTVDDISVNGSAQTSQTVYGIQRGTYTNKEAKDVATFTAELQRMVALSAWYRYAYVVSVTDAAAALCVPGDTGHFVYQDINESLRIIEITRSNEGGPATFKVATVAEDLSDQLQSTRKELATLNRSYQGVPTDTNDSFWDQFERTTGGVDVPAEVSFFIPYGADLMDLRLRYQIGGMRSFAKAVGGGGGTNTPSGGGSTSGSGGSSTPTSSSVGTPSGGGSTTPSGGGSTSGSTVSDIKTLPSVTRGPAVSGVYYEITINPTDRTSEYIYIQVGNFCGSTQSFTYQVRTATGGGGTLVGSGTLSSIPNNGFGAGVVTTSSYYTSVLYARVQMNAGAGNWLFTATRYGYGSHTHTTPAHTHATPDHVHPAHTHTVTIPSHTHTTPDHIHAIPAHVHTLDYGIYESSSPATVRVALDGTTITALNDLTLCSDFDLLPYCGKDSNGRIQEGWHTIAFASATNGATGSVRGCVFAQKFLSTEAA